MGRQITLSDVYAATGVSERSLEGENALTVLVSGKKYFLAPIL